MLRRIVGAIRPCLGVHPCLGVEESSINFPRVGAAIGGKVLRWGAVCRTARISHGTGPMACVFAAAMQGSAPKKRGQHECGTQTGRVWRPARLDQGAEGCRRTAMRSNAEVDWNIELGTIVRLAQGPGTGPAMLFNTIKDYSGNARAAARCLPASLASFRRIALMLGLPIGHASARNGEDGAHHADRPHPAAHRRAPGRSRRTSSRATTSTSTSSRCRGGTGSTAAAT